VFGAAGNIIIMGHPHGEGPMPQCFVRTSSSVLFLVMAAASSAPAQTVAPAAGRQAPPAATAAAPPSIPPKTLTGKERLGEKWTDEQRIDNCKVPVDKRGTKPRPDACAKPPS
jgi:hypothetical protein